MQKTLSSLGRRFFVELRIERVKGIVNSEQCTNEAFHSTFIKKYNTGGCKICWYFQAFYKGTFIEKYFDPVSFYLSTFDLYLKKR